MGRWRSKAQPHRHIQKTKQPGKSRCLEAAAYSAIPSLVSWQRDLAPAIQSCNKSFSSEMRNYSRTLKQLETQEYKLKQWNNLFTHTSTVEFSVLQIKCKYCLFIVLSLAWVYLRLIRNLLLPLVFRPSLLARVLIFPHSIDLTKSFGPLYVQEVETHKRLFYKNYEIFQLINVLWTILC